jgi:hypothetical protein
MVPMDQVHPYHVKASGRASGPVEAWSGYPLQFGGQRRFCWQNQMAADLRTALARLAISPDDVLSGTYLSTDASRCDVENRLFTNPGTSVFPKTVRSVRFERGLGSPPEPPAPVARVKARSAKGKMCPHACCRNKRVHPAKRLQAHDQRSLTTRDLARYVTSEGGCSASPLVLGDTPGVTCVNSGPFKVRPRRIWDLPGTVHGPKLQIMVFVLEPGTVQEGERDRRLLRHGLLKLNRSVLPGAIREEAKSASFGEHPEEVETGTMANEYQLGDDPVVVHEAPITSEACLSNLWHGGYQPVEVSVGHSEVCIVVVGQNGSFASPAQQ